MICVAVVVICVVACSLLDPSTNTEIASYRIHRILFCARGPTDSAERQCFAFTCNRSDNADASATFQCHVFSCDVQEAVSRGRRDDVKSSSIFCTSPFSHLMPPLCSNGPTFIVVCHTLRFHAISSVILYHFMSCLLLCSHLFLGLPFLIFPYTCMVIFSVIFPSSLNTWPNHRSRFCLRKVIIDSMLASLRMSSFLMRSFSVLPLAHLSILIKSCLIAN